MMTTYDLIVSDAIAAEEINVCKANIARHKEFIAQTFIDLGYANRTDDVKITIGPEIECTEVAGKKAHNRRFAEIDKQIHDKRGLEYNAKNDGYMPKKARASSLDQRFNVPSAIKDRVKERTYVELEPRFDTNLFIDQSVKETRGGDALQQDYSATSQIEFTSYPHSVEGVAPWINKILDKAVNGAKEINLRRIDTRALPNENTAPNSIHLNAVIGIKQPEYDTDNRPIIKNAFSQKEWTGQGPEGIPSDLALCVGKAHIDFLQHSLFLFARANSDYERYAPKIMMGPSIIGMLPRKEHNNFGTAMFRGEHRQTERITSAYKSKEDKGPFRFELRVPSPGAAGHPNKSAYPSQEALSYQMIEAYMKILADGVALWKERELKRRNGEKVEILTEEMLRPPEPIKRKELLDRTSGTLDKYVKRQSAKLPTSVSEAVETFLNSPEAINYWGDRMSLLVALSSDLDTIEAADYNPIVGEKKGPHVKRFLASSSEEEKKR